MAEEVAAEVAQAKWLADKEAGGGERFREVVAVADAQQATAKAKQGRRVSAAGRENGELEAQLAAMS
jgi:uncharacterized membrane protein